jgi:acyl carrier protein
MDQLQSPPAEAINMKMKTALRNFIVENFLFGQPMEFSDDDSLQQKGIVDSTGVLELVGFLEATFRVAVEDNELLPENLDSINRLVRFVESKLRSAADEGPNPEPQVA